MAPSVVGMFDLNQPIWEFPKIGDPNIVPFKGYHKGSFKGSIRVLEGFRV